jgi:hypothetical protein
MSFTKEPEMRQCKVCNQLKVRVQDGQFNLKDKRWMDERGRLWNGRTCPGCNLERAKKTMKQTRVKKRVEKDIDAKINN